MDKALQEFSTAHKNYLDAIKSSKMASLAEKEWRAKRQLAFQILQDTTRKEIEDIIDLE